MGQMLELSCGDCGTEEVQLDGPVMAGYQPRCEQCGEPRLAPWNGPAGGADGQRPSGEVLNRSIADQAGTCWCGGHFSLEAPLRCSVCRSTGVSTAFYGIAD